MGISGISIWQLVIILIIIILLFGTKRLKSFGGDLGSAIKQFKSEIKDQNNDKDDT
jgi:sec-independent protein translocase protein TatA